MHDPTELAYLAGIVDADGYITATMTQKGDRHYFGAQIGIAGSRREPHDLAAALFGGNVSTHQPSRDREHHRLQHHWQLGGRSAVPAIQALLPYLRIKVEQAHLALALQEQIDLLRYSRESRDFAPWQPAGHDPTPSLRACVEEIRELHARRGRTPARPGAGS